MVVTCPKCKTRLKVDEARLSPEGSRFKCPKCATVLMVRKPVVREKKVLDSRRVLVAHGNPEIISRIEDLLRNRGYAIITSQDGIDAMVKALKELPFLMIVDVALPKIYGFELCKRLKGRDETREVKCLLVGSIHDKSKYRREPASLYGADEYIEEHSIADSLLEKIDALRAVPEGPGGAAPAQEKPAPPAAEKPMERPVESPAEKPAERPAVIPAPKPAPPSAQPAAPAAPAFPGMPAAGSADDKVEKAKRLSRTIINDIYLYNTAKVDEAIKKNTFRSVFAAEIREGLKLYESRIPAEIRSKSDYYNEAIDNFIASKK